VTETTTEISLITSSILSKKFAEHLDCLVMDIKCGTSAFMTTHEMAMELANSIVGTCKEAGVKCNALVSRMDYPIGEMMGNVCEVMEAISAMDGSDIEYIDIINKIRFNENATGYIYLDTTKI
jgi:thymidine phosphorylase